MALNKNVAKGIKTRQENELLENNKLIAEFMGLCPLSRSGFISDKNQEYYGSLSDLQYHTSWKWLMDVVDKINETGRFEVIIGYGTCHITDAEGELTLSLQLENTRGVVYNTVVEFIKWYNEQDRFICGVCGDHVNEYTYNEDKDVDECNKCK